jgi:DNA polymerase-1
LYPKYKANRLQRPIDLIPQFDLVREAATAYGIPGMEASGFEADDVIATLATQALSEGIDTHILSGDKDLMQLVTPPGVAPYVHMIDPMSMSRVDHDVVVEKWGVPPEKIGDILALAGDTADNIPGVPGIGPKIAASLLEEYGSLEEIFRHVDGIKQSARREKLIEHQELALLSRKLVELERDIPSDRLNSIPSPMINVIDLRMEPLNGDRLLAFYRTMGFKTLQRQVKDRLEQNEIKTKRPKSTWSQRPKAQIPEPKEYEDVPF